MVPLILKQIEKILETGSNKDFIYPKYDGYSIANIPSTISNIFGIKEGKPIDETLYKGKIDTAGIEKVVLFVIDGLGYRMWLDSGKRDGFFAKVADRGLLAPITSVFPSTTACSITTLSTGLTPQEHALPEWTVYFDEIKMTINTLPFRSIVDDRLLTEKGINPKILYNGATIYQKFAKEKIKSFMFTHKSITDSPYNNIIKNGSAALSYIKPSDATIGLRKALESSRGKSYLNFYIDTVDSVTHFYGPYTEESRAEIANVSDLIETNFVKKVSKETAKKTLVIVIADHGHIKMNPKKVIYLNKDSKLVDMFAKDSDGKIIPPTGSVRDIFLHIDDSKLDKAYLYLTMRFKNIARVMKTEDALQMGLFGRGKINRNFNDRIGNVILLPYRNNGIWYEHTKGKKFKYNGMHGGLSRDEMLVPLGLARLSDLQ